MGQEQRNAIRKALNEDADKLLQEGDPADPQLRRLRREMEEVNRLFDEFERRARAEGETLKLIVLKCSGCYLYGSLERKYHVKENILENFQCECLCGFVLDVHGLQERALKQIIYAVEKYCRSLLYLWC
jgi:hypothetical protein